MTRADEYNNPFEVNQTKKAKHLGVKDTVDAQARHFFLNIYKHQPRL